MEQLGHFRILDRIGAGGMGEVYRAHDEKLQREVAVKLLPADSFSDKTARARLLREARAAASLNHPNICVVHEVGEAEGQAYIAMECVKGDPLSARLAEGPLPLADVIRYGIQLADALEHAHERDIVHRDLKPGNVILTPVQRLKVLDFGLATRLSDENSPGATTAVQLTQPGAIMGTPAYMAPEQLRGVPADARSDIWALGVMLYEMAGGIRPFVGNTWSELGAAILTAPATPLPAHVPADLRTVIARCLSKDPQDRYQRAGELRAALETMQSGSGVLPRRAASRQTWLIAAVLVTLTAATATLITTRPSRDASKAGPKFTSLAVLPLTNLSGDPEQEYFADGMTDALIADLGRMKGLQRVIARTSVMRFKGTTKAPKEIARELDVDVLLTGAVLRVGDRVRVTAELIDPETEQQIWTEVYERDVHDVLVMQADAAKAIATRLGVGAPPEKAPVKVHPEAHEAYLKGEVHRQRTGRKNMETALRYYELALENDPTYVMGHVGVARAWLGLSRGTTREPVPAEVGRPKAMAAALRAVELDPESADARLALASVYRAEWDWENAIREFQRAADLNPNDAAICTGNLEFGLFKGRPASVAELDRCAALDPLNASVQIFRGTYLRNIGRPRESAEQFEKILAVDDENLVAWYQLFLAYVDSGRHTEALQALKRHRRIQGDTAALAAIERGERTGGFVGVMRASAELIEERKVREPISTISVAAFWVLAGENDRALDWIERAFQQRDAWLVDLKTDMRWKTLRPEPRFQQVLERMNFPRSLQPDPMVR